MIYVRSAATRHLAAFADDDARRVGRDHVNGHFVSTVWLVIDHGHGGTPIPFETMIFTEHEGECELADWQERYASEDAALAGHDQATALARDATCGPAMLAGKPETRP